MKRVVLSLAILAASIAVAALDLSGSGFAQKGERTEDGQTFAVLDDGSGGELLFYAETEPSAVRIAGLRALYDAIRSWSGFEAATLRAINGAERLQIVAIPRRFSVEGVDLAQAVPSGVQLYRSTSTEYDFKVKSGSSIVRLRGVYSSWDELSAAVLQAFRDPAAFLLARDPLYALKRIAELDARVSKLEAGLSKLDSNVSKLEARISSLETTSVGGLETRTDGLENGLSVLQKDVSGLSSNLESLVARMRQLVVDEGGSTGQLEAALLAALNGDKPVNAEGLAKLVELKKADPTLDKAKAATALKAAGTPLSSREISAVFLVKFGER